MANQRTPMAPSIGPFSEAPNRHHSDRDGQRSRGSSTSPASYEDPNDDDFQPEPVSRNRGIDESKSRVLSRRATMIDDDEDDDATGSILERGLGARKRRASSQKLQLPAKRIKTPSAQGEAASSMIVMGTSAPTDMVVETTEIEEGQHDDPIAQRSGDSNDRVSEEAQHDDLEPTSSDNIPRDKHEKVVLEIRERFNRILRNQKQTNTDITAELEQCQEERDDHETRVFILETKLDRMTQDEDQWFEKSMAKFRIWKQKEIKDKTAVIQANFNRELAKEKKAMNRKYDTQDRRLADAKEEWKGKVDASKREASDAKKHYETLEKELRRETDLKISKHKPENAQAVREAKQEMKDLRQEMKKVTSELQGEKDKYQDLYAHAGELQQNGMNKKAKIRELEQALAKAQDQNSDAEAKYRREAEYLKQVEEKSKAQSQLDQRKFTKQYQITEDTEIRYANLRRSMFGMRQHNERNNQRIIGFEKEVGILKNEKASLEHRVKKLEDLNRQLEKTLDTQKTTGAAETRHPQDDSRHVRARSSSIDQQPGNQSRAQSTTKGVSDQSDIASRRPSISTSTTSKDPGVLESVKGEYFEGPPPGTPAEGREGGMDTRSMSSSQPTMQAGQMPMSSIFGEKDSVIAGDNADSVQNGGDAMEGLRFESNAGVARPAAEYGPTNVRNAAENKATGVEVGDEAIERTPGRSGSSTNTISPAEQRRLSGLLPQDRPWNRDDPFKNWSNDQYE